MNTATGSGIATSQDKGVYSIELSADQRGLIMYTGIAIGGYSLAPHLANKAVKKVDE